MIETGTFPPRPRRDSFPTHIADVVEDVVGGGRPHFPFRSWAAANRFEYKPESLPFLQHCGSAAEAFFARPFTIRIGAEFPKERVAVVDSHRLQLQVRAGLYYVDAVVSDGKTSLAIEIDGVAFHRWTQEQVAQDYLRQRRLVLLGHTVVRFTAREAFTDPNECWRQVYAILAKRRNV